MKIIPASGSAVVAALLAGCMTAAPVADLAQNCDLYRDVEFATRVPGDRTAFMTPVADERRTDVLPAAQGAFPIAYDGDHRWNRPVPDMVDEIVRRELDQSGLFARLCDQAAGADLVLMPSLVTFATGAMEVVAGARSLCEVSLRLRVFGPVPAPGAERPLLLDQVYGDRQLSDAMRLPPSRLVLVGAALRNTVQRLLQAIDGSNVSRTGVPLTLPEPAASR